MRRLCSHSLPIQTFKSSILDGRLIYTLYKDSWRQLQEASAPRHQGDSQIRDYGYGTSLTFQQLPSALYRAFSRLFFFLTDPICAQGTKDVRLDPQLNKKVWESGIKGVPFRLRVRISRKRNDEEGAKEKLYSYVQAVNVKEKEAKGLQTVVVEDS